MRPARQRTSDHSREILCAVKFRNGSDSAAPTTSPVRLWCGRCSPASGPIRGGWIVAALGHVWTAPGWQERAAVGRSSHGGEAFRTPAALGRHVDGAHCSGRGQRGPSACRATGRRRNQSDLRKRKLDRAPLKKGRWCDRHRAPNRFVTSAPHAIFLPATGK